MRCPPARDHDSPKQKGPGRPKSPKGNARGKVVAERLTAGDRKALEGAARHQSPTSAPPECEHASDLYFFNPCNALRSIW